MASYVYFVTAENGLCKIGHSAKPEARLDVLQLGSPVKLTLHAAVLCHDAYRVESALHCACAHLRSHGEWFGLGQASLDEAVQLAQRMAFTDEWSTTVAALASSDLQRSDVETILRFLDLQVEHAPSRTRPKFRLLQAKRDRLLVYLGLFAGLRVNEICGLRIEAVDLNGGNMTVVGRGEKERTVSIHPRLAPLLADWISGRQAATGLMFWGIDRRSRLSPGAVRLKCESISRWVKLPFKLRPGKLRKAIKEAL